MEKIKILRKLLQVGESYYTFRYYLQYADNTYIDLTILDEKDGKVIVRSCPQWIRTLFPSLTDKDISKLPRLEINPILEIDGEEVKIVKTSFTSWYDILVWKDKDVIKEVHKQILQWVKKVVTHCKKIEKEKDLVNWLKDQLVSEVKV